ncbi:MAG: DEAD/DEAH box helicase [Candidatus Fermentibacter sp.]|nr:DEAD/DEAH box helicase [Candidatus Fermentibacter sp.]
MTLLSRPTWPTRPTAPAAPPCLDGLRDYQCDGVAWLRSRLDRGLSSALWDEMGLGKTAQSLRALPLRARCLVVCPASVRGQWIAETRRWRPDLRPAPHEGRPPMEGEVLVMSYDALPDLDPRSPALFVGEDWSQVVAIFDEAHRASNADAARTRKVRRLVGQCRAAWALTGTPLRGTAGELWGLLVTFGLSREAFPGGRDEYDRMCSTTYEEVYVRRLGRSISKPRHGEIGPEVEERLRAVALRRLSKDHLDLPPVEWIDVPCEAPRDLRDYLDSVTPQWNRYDPDELPPFELYSAATAALARSRCAAAVDLARDVARDRQVLVFSAHLDPIHAVSKALRVPAITGAESDRERQATVARFMGGKQRVLPATIQVGGEGLNLQAAGAGILVDQTFVPAETEQAVRRFARYGQKLDRVFVYRMVTDHPLDQRICRIHDQKRRLAAQIVDGGR